MMNRATQETKAEAETREIVLSGNPDKAVQEMIDIITALQLIYQEENEALDKADVKAFSALQERKIEITQNYMVGTSQLLAREEQLKTIDLELREKFQSMHTEFMDVTAENLKLLERMQNGVKRLHGRIVDAAKEIAAKDGVNYSAGGFLNNQSHNVSMGLNESA